MEENLLFDCVESSQECSLDEESLQLCFFLEWIFSLHLSLLRLEVLLHQKYRHRSCLLWDD